MFSIDFGWLGGIFDGIISFFGVIFGFLLTDVPYLFGLFRDKFSDVMTILMTAVGFATLFVLILLLTTQNINLKYIQRKLLERK